MPSLTFVTQCTLYWNVTQSLSMFLHTPQLVINLLITLHSFLTWGNKACNINVTVTSTQLIYYYEPWWFTCDPNDELNKLLVTLRLSSVRLFGLIAPTGWSGPGPWWLDSSRDLGLVSGKNPEELTTCIHYR